MTSELTHIITTLRTQIEQRNVVCPIGYDSVFRDPETDQIYFRRFNTSQELERFGMDDRMGNFFYLRFSEVEQSELSATNKLSSCHERILQTITMRAVFIYQASDIFEVGDYLLNVILGTDIANFRNISNVKIDPTQIKYDYFNWDGDDTGGIIRTYLPHHQSTAIDISVIFAREYDECRNPPNIT